MCWDTNPKPTPISPAHSQGSQAKNTNPVLPTHGCWCTTRARHQLWTAEMVPQPPGTGREEETAPLTCAGHASNVTGFADEILHDRQDTELVPSVLKHQAHPSEGQHPKKHLPGATAGSAMPAHCWSSVGSVPAHLGQVLGKKLALGPEDGIVQDLPPLPDAELHDVAVDGKAVVGRREPRQEDALLCPVGCEAPRWGNQHQRLWSCYRECCGQGGWDKAPLRWG